MVINSKIYIDLEYGDSIKINSLTNEEIAKHFEIAINNIFAITHGIDI